MTLQEQVGQLLIIGIAGTKVTPRVAEQLRAHWVGGVCLFKRNLASAAQTARLTRDLRAQFAGRVPPFIAIDQEGGEVVRIADRVAVLPGNMALGATRSRPLAYAAGRAQATDLRLLGFNMNLAPVLDVNDNPKNPVIGVRSFGDRAGMVAEFGTEFVRGQQDADIATVAKHFPGHGGTSLDSHRVLPASDATLSELVNTDLAPFRAVIDIGLDGVMSAHIAVPKLTLGVEEPATVSSAIISGLLRGKLGFRGLVLTDELEMEAIAGRYGAGHAAVMAVRAGADMVLVPWRPERQEEVYAALVSAVQRGEIATERLSDALRHVLALKRARHVLDDPPPPLETALAALGDPGRQRVARDVARASLTLLRAEPGTLPLDRGRARRVAVISAQPHLLAALEQRLPSAVSMRLPHRVRRSAETALAAEAAAVARAADRVVLAIGHGSHLRIARAVLATGRPAIAVVAGSPYLADELTRASAIVVTYSMQDVSAEAAVAALLGEGDAPGRLPVTLSHWPFGTGLGSSASAPAPAAASPPRAVTVAAPSPHGPTGLGARGAPPPQ